MQAKIDIYMWDAGVDFVKDINILVISDTHGNTNPIRQLLANYQGIVSAVVHLGDYTRDMSCFAISDKDKDMYHIVIGNNDPLIDIYDERVITVGGIRMFITHGHRYNVKSSPDKLIYRAQELNVHACLFGHTHKPVLFTEKNIVFLNPGSPTYPYPETNRGYGLLRISEDGNLTGKLVTYKERSCPGL